MIEQIVPAVIAIITGGAVLFNRVHNRVHDIDKRLDGVELRIAEAYVSKADFANSMNRMESHLVRIEEKMDDLIKTSRPCPPNNNNSY